MKKLLQAGFGEPIGRAALDLIKSLGFDGVRLDLTHAVGDLLVRELCIEVTGAGLTALPILADTSQVPALPPSVDAAELLNEPDLHNDPRVYKTAARLFINTCNQHGVTPYVGCISNLTPTALQWLQAALPEGFDYRVTIHRYPDDARFLKAHSPFVSRADEVLALGRVLAGRKFGVSEFGYHDLLQQPSKTWWKRLFFLKDRITPEEQLANVKAEFDLWSWAGADFATLYQLNDGPPGSDWQGHYGIRSFDGALKPVAQCCK